MSIRLKLVLISLLAIISVFLMILIRKEIRMAGEQKARESSITIESHAVPIWGENDIYNITMRVFDNKDVPVKNAFVSIYTESDGEPVYAYTILRTSKSGELAASLKKGSYDVIVSTDHKIGVTKLQDLSFILHFPIRISGKQNITETVILKKFSIAIVNTPFQLPKMKVEAKWKARYGFTPSQPLAIKKLGRETVDFYISDGVYNINLDPMSFDPQRPVSFALVEKEISVPQVNNLVFDFTQLKPVKIEVENLNNGWFKLDSTDSGDFQSMYFGEPVTVYTNLSDLQVEAVYAPLEQCVNSVYSLMLERKDEADPLVTTLGFCIDSDIAYTFRDVWTRNADEYIILQPTSLELIPSTTKIKQGDTLLVDFRLKDKKNNVIRSMFVHQLWDEEILPMFFFKDTTGKVLYETDLFDTNYERSKQKKLKRQICFPPGHYLVEAKMPIGTWGEDKFLSASFALTVVQGFPCAAPESEMQGDIPNATGSWQELYLKRDALLRISYGYIATFPSYPKDISGLSERDLAIISSCSGLEETGEKSTIVVELKPETVFDIQNQSEFTICLKNYSLRNPGKTYILRDSFFSNFLYPNSKQYIFYHYYLVLHSSPNSSVGVLVEKMYDLFYGFPDFLAINPRHFLDSTFNSSYPLSTESVKKWVSSYAGLITSPVIYEEQLPDKFNAR